MKVPMKIVLLALAALGFLFSAGGSMGQTTASPNGIEGVWDGVLAGQLHLVVTITKSSSGELGGTMNSVDQHAVLALSNVTLQGAALRFEVPRVGGVYEGKLKKWPRHFRQLDADGRCRAGARFYASRGIRRRRPLAELGAGGGSEAEHTPKPLLPKFNAVVPIAPTAFKADGKWHLVYELHISNMDIWDYAFTRIEVISADARQKTLATFSGADLDGMFSHPGVPAEKSFQACPRRIRRGVSVGKFRQARGYSAGDCRAHQREDRRLPGGALRHHAAYQREQKSRGGDFFAAGGRRLGSRQRAVEHFGASPRADSHQWPRLYFAALRD